MGSISRPKRALLSRAQGQAPSQDHNWNRFKQSGTQPEQVQTIPLSDRESTKQQSTRASATLSRMSQTTSPSSTELCQTSPSTSEHQVPKTSTPPTPMCRLSRGYTRDALFKPGMLGWANQTYAGSPGESLQPPPSDTQEQREREQTRHWHERHPPNSTSPSFRAPTDSFRGPGEDFGRPGESFGGPGESFTPRKSLEGPGKSIGGPGHGFLHRERAWRDPERIWRDPEIVQGNSDFKVTLFFSK